MSENNNNDTFRSYWRSISKIRISKISREGIEITHPGDRERSTNDQSRSSQKFLSQEKVVKESLTRDNYQEILVKKKFIKSPGVERSPTPILLLTRKEINQVEINKILLHFEEMMWLDYFNKYYSEEENHEMD